MSARATLLEQLLDLAWSHWVALGVAGAVPGAEAPVDLEALLILTAELAPVDPRLRDEALDWCSRFHGFASKPRLKQLLRRSPASAQSAFGSFASALEQHAGANWPGSSGAVSVPTSLSGKSRLPALTHPALLSLRLRALFGVGARADIIGSVLSRGSNDFGAADLVFIGYSKRNLAEALDMLAGAGLFRATRAGNRVRFSWQRQEELSDLLSPVPEVIPVWSSRLRVVSGFLDLLPRARYSLARPALPPGRSAAPSEPPLAERSAALSNLSPGKSECSARQTDAALPRSDVPVWSCKRQVEPNWPANLS